MRSTPLLNLLANAATVSVASAVLAQKHPTTNSQNINDVGLRGQGGVARVVKGAASFAKPESVSRTMDKSSSTRNLRETRSKNKSKAASTNPVEMETFADEFEARLKSSKPRMEEKSHGSTKEGRRHFILPSTSDDEDEIVASSSRLQPRNEYELEVGKSREKKEKKTKKPKEKSKKKDKRDKAQEKQIKYATRNGWLPTPSPVTLVTPVPTERPATQEPTLAPTEEPTLKPSESPVTSTPTASPTFSPSLSPTSEDEDVPFCPSKYDTAFTGYTAGDTVEMDSGIFECQSGPYEAYCSIGELDLSWNETAQEWWQDSWYYVEACEHTIQAMTTEKAVEFGTTTSPATAAATPTEPILSPDDAYDDKDWGDLPEDIRNAMSILGYNAGIWNEGSNASTDDLDWDELNEDEQGAAIVIGYTEELWMNEERGETTLDFTALEAQVTAEEARAPDTTITTVAAATSTEVPVIETQAPITTIATTTTTTSTTATTIPTTTTTEATTTEATTTEATTTEATTTEATTTETTTTEATTTEATTTEAPATTTAATTTAVTTEEITTLPATLVLEDELSAESVDVSNTPTGYPTYMPTQSWPPCPPPFDPATSYAAGDLAEVGEHAFQCSTEDNGAYEKYCNIPDWDNSLLEDDENAKEMWEGAWAHVEPCVIEGNDRL